CQQMAGYFDTGPGRDAMGAAAPHAAACCRRLADELSASFASMTKSGDIPKVRAFSLKWAAEHPIHESIAGRASVVARMAEFQSEEGLSTGETIAQVTTTLDDLNRKVEVYSGQLFRQARWEAERLKLQWVSELRV